MLKHSEVHKGKKPVPWNTNLGIPNLAATCVAQGKKKSATRHVRWSSFRSCSRGSWSMVVALKNLFLISSPVSWSLIQFTFSHPSGKPTSRVGNLMVWISISKPIFLVLWILFEYRLALTGVVTMVVLASREAKSLAMSIVGIKWPWAMKGKKKICGCWLLALMISQVGKELNWI